MSSEWDEVTLGEVCAFAAGSAFPKSQQGSLTGEFPFVKVSDLSLPGNERFLVGSNNWVSSDQVAQMKVKLVPPNSTVFAKIGEGLKSERLRLTARPTAIDNNLMAAIPDVGRVAPDFLRYLLETIGLGSWAHGSALPYLRQSDLQGISVSIPPLAEQGRIAGVLGALDDLIEVNQALIGNLIQASRAIVLRHLSGPFGPLSSILDLRRGVGYRSADFSESTGIPSISMGASSSSGLLKRAKIRLLDKDVPNKYLVEPYDIVMANVDLTWDFGILAWPVVVPEYLGSSVAITSDMYGLRLRKEHADLGIAVWAQLMDDRFRDWVASCAKGTTVASIAQRDVLQFEVRTGVSEAARVAAREMLRLVWSLEEENLSLHQSRHEILPLLMSGRVHVGNVAA